MGGYQTQPKDGWQVVVLAAGAAFECICKLGSECEVARKKKKGHRVIGKKQNWCRREEKVDTEGDR